MTSRLTATGIEFPGGGDRRGIAIPFQDSDSTQNDITTGRSWTRLFDTKEFQMPARCAFVMHFRGPCREENNPGWAGMYVRQYYSVNGGSYVYLGDSGYTTAMYDNAEAISGHNHQVKFDFTDFDQPFGIRFRFDAQGYSTMRTGGSNNIENGDSTYTGTSSNWWQVVTINGFSYPE